MAYCGHCLHLDVCKSADACDGRVPGCKHFIDKHLRDGKPVPYKGDGRAMLAPTAISD